MLQELKGLMLSLTTFLARRFLQTSSHERAVHAMLYFCFVSIALCTCALALIAAIMQGFEKKTLEQFKGVNPDIIIRSIQKPLDQELMSEIQKEFGSQIEALIPISYHYGMIDTKIPNQKQAVVRLIALNPEQLTSLFPAHYIQSSLPSGDLLKKHGCLLGSSLATAQHLSLQQKITLWYLPEQDETEQNKLIFDRVTLMVHGYLKTGIEELDENTLICSRELFNQLFSEPTIDTLGIKTHHPELLQSLKKRLSDVYHISTWQELYPLISSVTKLEKYVAICIIGLVCMVACSTLSALMFMLMTSKQREYALLNALGYSQHNIRKLFLCIGMGLSVCAALVGIVVAGMLSFLLERTQLIQIPDVYYVNYVPADFTLGIAVSTFIFVLCIGFFATLIPLRSFSVKSVMNVLKFN